MSRHATAAASNAAVPILTTVSDPADVATIAPRIAAATIPRRRSTMTADRAADHDGTFSIAAQARHGHARPLRG